MPMFKLTHSRFGTALLGAAALTMLVGVGCAGQGGGKKSSLLKWMEDPSTAQKVGNKLYWPDLGTTFEKPDTLYVFKECNEASHGPDGSTGWIPVLVCSAVPEEGTDEYAEEAPEMISVKFSLTEKTRPLDERTVSWFENQYKEAGFTVDDISFQHDYQNKSGIYARLQVTDGNGNPTRELIRYMFPKRDVVFIAEVEYPFNDARAIEQDWKYLLWNFDIDADPNELEGGGDGGGEEEEAPDQGESDIEG